MTKVISTINLKGGVGKTQMTVALAEFLASVEDKKVLLIDLDPQTNATVALMDEKEWKKKDKAGETLLQMFKDILETTHKFNPKKAIVKKVSNLKGGIEKLDLLPSSLGLIQVQDGLLLASGRGINPMAILKKSLSRIIEQYEIILIDCPPNLGMITLNGLYLSDYYLIPVIPDILSTYGIPSILNRVEEIKRESEEITVEPLGIVISMYRAGTKLHNEVLSELRKHSASRKYPRIFNTIIPMAIKTAEAADFEARVNTLKQKYGYSGAYENYSTLTKEFLDYVKE